MADQITGRFLRKYYFSQVAGTAYRTTYAIDSTYAELLVFGSSRANHHYVPDIFENKLKMSFYNAGQDGSSILYYYAVFKTILTRYNPKIVIMDINPSELYYSKESYDRLSSLLPYYKDHPEVRSIVKLRSPYENYKLLSAIYPFNSNLFSIGIGNMELNKSRRGDYKGYVPLLNQMKDTILYNLQVTHGAIDRNKVFALKSIAQICKKNNISLLLTYSPIFLKVLPDETNRIIEQLAKENNITFLNYANYSFFMEHPAYFQDRSHLNKDGAMAFSQMVAKQMTIYLNRAYIKIDTLRSKIKNQ